MKFEINNLYKKYKTFCLDNVSFTMESGSIVGLIGVNGAGKSTILRILVGLTTKDSGEILADGQKISNISEKLRVGFVSQNLDIYKDQKMSSVATFVKDVYKSMWDDDLYKKYLYDVFKLTDDLKIKELSTGMRVKFFLALELAKNPECLLLDEVTSGLDPMVRDEVLDILIDIAQEKNIPILLSSHITEDLEKIANHIVYIDNGRILLEDSVETLRSNYFKIDEEEIKELDEESRQIILEKGIKQHQYYIYDVSLLGDYKKAGSAALLSDILPYLRKK